MKKTSLFVVLCLFSSGIAVADQVPVGPIVGRAVTWQTVTFTPASGPAHTERLIRQRVVVGGATFDIISYCFPDQYGYFSSECNVTNVLGYCNTNQAIFSTTSTDGTQVYSQTVSCTDLHVGNCLSMTGVILPDTRHKIDSLQSVGGCQY